MTTKLKIAVWVVAASATLGAAMQQGGAKYGPAMYPVPPKPPKTIDEALPVARNLVRMTAGRSPLGWVKSGQRAVIFTEPDAWLEGNYIVLKAMAQAFKERQVEVLFVLPPLKQDWIQVGPTYDVDAFGWSEAVNWINGMLLACTQSRMAARNLLPICSNRAGEVIGLPRWSCRK